MVEMFYFFAFYNALDLNNVPAKYKFISLRGQEQIWTTLEFILGLGICFWAVENLEPSYHASVVRAYSPCFECLNLCQLFY